MKHRIRIRTQAELEAALDNHRFTKLHGLTLAAVDAGNANDARVFAHSLASHCRQQRADLLTFGDEPALLADIRDERATMINYYGCTVCQRNHVEGDAEYGPHHYFQSKHSIQQMPRADYERVSAMTR